MQEPTITEVAKVAPPASISGLTLFSVHVNDWVMVFTLVYTILIIIDKLSPGSVAAAFRWLGNLLRRGHE